MPLAFGALIGVVGPADAAPFRVAFLAGQRNDVHVVVVDAIKAWVYPGESIGYEFVYSHDEAMTLSKRYHTSVLSKAGDTVERIDEAGKASPSR